MMDAVHPYAMRQAGPGQKLARVSLEEQELKPHDVRIAVRACGVCRTDLHVVDGELPNPVYPIIPGHEIIGHVDRLGADVFDFAIGQRVGVSWLAETCGHCAYCKSGRENLCDAAKFT